MRGIRLIAIATVLVGLAAGAARAEEGKKYLIRPDFENQEGLLYQLNINGIGKWKPEINGIRDGETQMEFVFKLLPKAVRANGACTYELIGEQLKGRAETQKGEIECVATRERCTLQVGRHKRSDNEHNPLRKPMTVTLGPRNAFRYGTGLMPLLPFFIVHVDHRLWVVLTTAPLEEVGVGDTWKEDYNYQIPDSRGRPLSVTAHAKVTGWETYKGRRCLAGRLVAKLELKDTWVTLKNGDRVHVHDGVYNAEGKVLWDVEKGILCYANAKNSLVLRTDKPTRKALNCKVATTLRLLGEK